MKAQSEFTPSRRRTLAILYQQLGQLYRETSNYAAAVNTFEEMLRLGPEEDRRARVMIIDTYRDARDIPKALDAAAQGGRRLSEGSRHPRHPGACSTAKTRRPIRPPRSFAQLLDGSAADFEIQLDLAQVYRAGQALARSRTGRSRGGKDRARTLRKGNGGLPARRDF